MLNFETLCIFLAFLMSTVFSATDLQHLFKLLGQISADSKHALHSAANLVATQYLAYLDKQITHVENKEKPSFFKDMLLNFSALFEPVVSIHLDLEQEQLAHKDILEKEGDEFVEQLRTIYWEHKTLGTNATLIPRRMNAQLSIQEVKEINHYPPLSLSSNNQINVNASMIVYLFSQNIDNIKTAIRTIFSSFRHFFPSMVICDGFARIRQLLQGEELIIDAEFVSQTIQILYIQYGDDDIKTELLKTLCSAYVSNSLELEVVVSAFYLEENLRSLAHFFLNCDNDAQLFFLLNLLVEIAEDEDAAEILVHCGVYEQLHQRLSSNLSSQQRAYFILLASKLSLPYAETKALAKFNTAEFFLDLLKLRKSWELQSCTHLSQLEEACYNFMSCSYLVFIQDEPIINFAIENLTYLPKSRRFLIRILCIACDEIICTTDVASPPTVTRTILFRHAEKLFLAIKPLIYSDEQIPLFHLIYKLLQADPNNTKHFFNLKIDAEINDFLFSYQNEKLYLTLLIISTYIKAPEGKAQLTVYSFRYINTFQRLRNTSENAYIADLAHHLYEETRVFIHDRNIDLLTKADTLRNEDKIGQAKNGYEKIIEGREYNADVTNYAAFLGLAICYHKLFRYLAYDSSQSDPRLFGAQQAKQPYDLALCYYQEALNLTENDRPKIQENIDELNQIYTKYCNQHAFSMALEP